MATSTCPHFGTKLPALRATPAPRHRRALVTVTEEAHKDCSDEPKNIKASATQHFLRTASLATQAITCAVTNNVSARSVHQWAVVADRDAQSRQSQTRGIGASVHRGPFLLPRARSASQSLDPRRRAEARECRNFVHQ